LLPCVFGVRRQSQKRSLNVDADDRRRDSDVIGDVIVDRKRKSAASAATRVTWGRDVLLANHCGPAAPATRSRTCDPDAAADIDTDDDDIVGTSLARPPPPPPPPHYRQHSNDENAL